MGLQMSYILGKINLADYTTRRSLLQVMSQELIKPQEAGVRNHEVEVRSLLTSEQYEAIKGRLLDNEVEFLGEEIISDIYYCPIATKSFQEIEMDEVGSYSLRLRNRFKEGSSTADLNMKVITEYGDHNAWREHEVTVSSFDEAQEMLTVLGFKPFFQLNKHRTSFTLNDMTVALEDIQDYGYVLEVEIMAEKKRAEEAKNTIKDFMRESGITDNQIVPKSVTNLLMRERASF